MGNVLTMRLDTTSKLHAIQAVPVRSSGAIGVEIREFRRSRNWTLNEFANQLGRLVCWLSQVERNVSEPALDNIRKIASLFSLSVSFFFTAAANDDEPAYIVRAQSRRMMSDKPKGCLKICFRQILVVLLRLYIRYFSQTLHVLTHLFAQPKRRAMCWTAILFCSLTGHDLI